MASARHVLERIHDEAWAALREAEPWDDSYQQAPGQWHALLATENRLKSKLTQYFRDLAIYRVAGWVDWGSYPIKTTFAKHDLTVTINSQQAQGEQFLMLNVMLDDLQQMIGQGVSAADVVYAKEIGESTVNQLIRDEAQDHAAELAKGLTQTTLKDVQRSIEQSIAQGKKLQEAAEALQKTIADPRRAELIARTESVRAYNHGILAYGKQTGAATKEWSSLPGADAEDAEQPCVDDDDEGEIPIDDDFTSGDPCPPAHPNCRCGLLLHYGDETELG